MAPLHEPGDVIALVSTLLVLLLNVEDALLQSIRVPVLVAEDPEVLGTIQECHDTLQDLSVAVVAILYYFRVFNSYFLFSEDLGFWVKPRSTAWFTCFVIDQYDDARWVQHFRMCKSSVFRLSEMQGPYIQKQNTRYRLAILVVVRLCCTLFKLA
jgi:hypothetical protein